MTVKMDRTAFWMGSAEDAHQNSIGSELTPDQRLTWARRMKLRILNLDPDKTYPMDRTAFSMRSHSQKPSAV